MSAVTQLSIPLAGMIGPVLRVAVVPRTDSGGVGPLLDRRGEPSFEGDVPPVQLLENCEFLYEWADLPEGIAQVVTDPEEVFQPDTSDGLRGRLRPGLSVGTLHVVLRSGHERLGELELEVRSRKLDYLSEYRWMLRDIADQVAEIVMNRFAASETTFAQDEARDSVTLYQRFAFLRALFTSESFQSALVQITRRPYVAWVEKQERVRSGEPVRPNARNARQMLKAGPRQPWPGGVLKSIPRGLVRYKTEATDDTTANRFVKFALERWRSVMLDIGRALSNMGEGSAIARGRREISQTVEQIESILQLGIFRGLSPLARFPSDDQVLQRREGYREVFRAYLEFELAARLSWKHPEAEYRAGQQDIAALYEVWAFLQLASCIAGLVGKEFDMTPLVEMHEGGLNLTLKAGKESVVSGSIVRGGRKLSIELYFNRTFAKGAALGSWSRPMRPDFSLVIRSGKEESVKFEPFVLHFDAKYRVNFLNEIFGVDGDVANAVKLDARGGPVREDLLKMHAYRDAIRRSAGAYVLFPGGDSQIGVEPFKEYRELLPGLGAFVMRPSSSGDAAGIASLRNFLADVFDHVATRLTQHERGRFWLQEVYGTPPPRDIEISDVHRPGPDTTILLGYVKSKVHWDWIVSTRSYNVRALGREGGISQSADLLRSHFLLLYCPSTGLVKLARIVSDPEFVSSDAIARTGYPEPGGDYLCVQWRWASISNALGNLTPNRIVQFVSQKGKPEGTPIEVRWFEVVNLPP